MLYCTFCNLFRLNYKAQKMYGLLKKSNNIYIYTFRRNRFLAIAMKLKTSAKLALNGHHGHKVSLPFSLKLNTTSNTL